jgi:hypothetical protein
MSLRGAVVDCALGATWQSRRLLSDSKSALYSYEIAALLLQ